MSDDFGDSDDEALIFAATQIEPTQSFQSAFSGSPRPAKRRRVSPISEASDDEEAFAPAPLPTSTKQRARVNHPADIPTLNFSKSVPRQQLDGPSSPANSDVENDIIETLDDQLEREAAEREKSGRKSRHLIHIPQHEGEIQDQFYTQPPPGPTQPHLIRGPIWRKPGKIMNERFEVEDDSGIGFDEQELAAKRALQRAQLRNVPSGNTSLKDELENLPSDAFDSSSPARGPDSNAPRQVQRLGAPLNGLRQTTLFGRDAANVPASQANKRFNWPLAQKDEPPTHHKLDAEGIKTWVYPTNLGTIRDYQFNIVARGLFHNTLVALPTGLGKTFIAATIMFNWFRWTKDAQIVFAAPTRPLVAQQIEACFNIVGIPRSQTSMLTGGISQGLRAEEWATKRVFFCTPQTLLNDLKLGTCDPKRIVLFVADEAHRATGAYAYVEVVKFLRRFNESVRVLGLTATPGGDVEGVQKVIDGLKISRVEIRTEQSLDIRSYVHKRKIEKVVFDNSEEMVMLMDLYSKAVQPVLNVLTGQNAYWQKDPIALTPFGLTKAKQAWFASDAGKHANVGVKGMVSSIFAILAGLAHGMELLKYHGITPFFHSLQAFRTQLDEGSKSKYKKQINESPHFEKMMVRLRAWVGDPEFVGHPKLSHLRQEVLNHLMDAGEGTRIMVFAHFRDAAEEIVNVLNRDKPMVKAHVFVGQAGSKHSEGMTQKKQEEIVQKFKNGEYNTLVATSIGEEGLDIGEVDLIICYDSKASPIRMLQRMGRTGRKREGKIVLFQMRGKEENDAEKAKDSYEKMQEMIADGGRFNFHDDLSRRILPKEVQPIVDKRVIEIPLENSQAGLPTPTRKRKVKRPQKKFHMPDGVATGFVTVSSMNGGGAGGGTSRSKQKKQKVVVEQPIPIPGLGEVVLNEADEKAWERQYRYVVDEEDAFVSAPRLDAYPEHQRNPSKTRFV
ncbi:P-loop containing nucleoside triphosphate hydrolase protein, partial [Rhizodiscina lignyota]